MKDEEYYKIFLDTFGEETQFQCAIEEMGKLLQAICKYKRKVATGDEPEIKKALENLQEEIADVSINIGQLSFMFGQDKINEIKQYKLDRALKRAKNKNKEGWNS